MDTLHPNSGKQLEIQADGDTYLRFPIRTHVVTKDDDALRVIQKYAAEYLKDGDVLCISERVVAITQGRSYHIDSVKPSKLASFLVRFVHKSPYGIGLGSPVTMELAIREVGTLRILLAACAAAVTKPLGIKGVFYRVGGRAIAAIDGPCDYTLPPYNKYATLAPKHPVKTAKMLADKIGHPVAIIDANDLGFALMGASEQRLNHEFLAQVFKDNPLGQSSEQTPICVVRKQHRSS